MKLLIALLSIFFLIMSEVSTLDYGRECIIKIALRPLSACKKHCRKLWGPDAVGYCKGKFCACEYYAYEECHPVTSTSPRTTRRSRIPIPVRVSPSEPTSRSQIPVVVPRRSPIGSAYRIAAVSTTPRPNRLSNYYRYD